MRLRLTERNKDRCLNLLVAVSLLLLVFGFVKQPAAKNADPVPPPQLEPALAQTLVISPQPIYRPLPIIEPEPALAADTRFMSEAIIQTPKRPSSSGVQGGTDATSKLNLLPGAEKSVPRTLDYLLRIL